MLPITITHLGALGDGIGESDGKKFYVPFTAPGDELVVKPTTERGDGYEAEVVEEIAVSKNRAIPPCPHYFKCGGCTTQHLADNIYTDWKRNLAVEAVKRCGYGEDIVTPLARTSPGQRQRVTLVAHKKNKDVLIGFHEKRSSQIVNITHCMMLLEDINSLIEPLRKFLTNLMSDGSWLDVSVTHTNHGLDVVLIGKLNLDLQKREMLANFASACGLARLSHQIKPHDEPEPISARLPVQVTFGQTTVTLPPGTFLQASQGGEQEILKAVVEGIGGVHKIADLFAGCGTLTFPMAETGRTVHAFEISKAAVDTIKSANVKFIMATQRDLHRLPLTADELNKFDAVVLDPPRSGAETQCINLAKSNVQRIIMVSCSHSTFARDAKKLIMGKYELKRVVPIDQFVQSSHLELVGTFVRNNQDST